MKSFLDQLLRFLPAVGFSTLSGLSGIGVTWLVVAMMARNLSQSGAEKLLTEVTPILIAGGVAGFIAGAIVSVMVLKMDPVEEARIESRYVGLGGRLDIYLGVPLFFIILPLPFLQWLGHKVGQNADVWVNLGIGLVILALSLVLYDHIPWRLIMPLSVIAWILNLAMLVWFFFFGPGAFGHSTF